MLMADGGADRLPRMGRRQRGGFQSGMSGMTPELRALIIKAQQEQGGWPGWPVGMFMPGQGSGGNWGEAAPFGKMYDGMSEGFPGAKSVNIMSGGPLTGGIAYNDGQDMINKLIASAEQNMANMSRKQKNKAKADAGIAREKKGKGGGSKPPASAPPPAQPAPPKKSKKAKVAPPVEY